MAAALKLKDARGGDEAAQTGLLEELKANLGDEVDQQLLKGGEDGLSSATLRRWLVAKKWVLADAVRDLKAHAAWRVAYTPDGFVSEESIAAELAQNKTYLHECDNQGHPLTIVIVKRHVPQKDNSMCTRLIVYSLDAVTKMGSKNPDWDGKAVGILDLSGMTLQNYDVAALRAVFDTLQNHYPERLAKMYLYCAPFIFYGLWKIVSAFVDPVTREKVQFVFKDAATAAVFARDFPTHVLPTELGGTGEWVAVEAAVARMRLATGLSDAAEALAKAAAAAVLDAPPTEIAASSAVIQPLAA